MSTEEKLRRDLTQFADKCDRDSIEYKTMARTLERTAWVVREALGKTDPATAKAIIEGVINRPVPSPDNSDLQPQPEASGWRS